MKILFAWLGRSDLDNIASESPNDRGPIEQAVASLKFEKLLLLSNWSTKETADYIEQLTMFHEIALTPEIVELNDPTDFRRIYRATTEAADRYIQKLKKTAARDYELYAHITPGTPAMGTIWALLAKSQYRFTLIQSSRQQGVRIEDFPFELAVEFIPAALETVGEKLREALPEVPKEGANFGDIKYKSPVMAKTVHLAKKVAVHDIPVVIEGETGTGKELFARAIHHASPRAANRFVPINCGAIPKDQVEAELFGVAKSAFTGVDARIGHFENANKGTVFLDEITDLPLDIQVRLLRVLQENEFYSVGAPNKLIKVNTRIIAASHKNLKAAVEKGTFREDLYYRLIGMNLTIPPLRKRAGDIGFLTDVLLEQVNNEYRTQKTLSAGAKKLLLSYEWPGNVREMLSTLRRAAVWADDDRINKADMELSLGPSPVSQSETEAETILNRELGEKFNLESLKSEVDKHYISRAMKEAKGKKRLAAKLLGIKNYQTLTNRIIKLAIG